MHVQVRRQDLLPLIMGRPRVRVPPPVPTRRCSSGVRAPTSVPPASISGHHNFMHLPVRRLRLLLSKESSRRRLDLGRRSTWWVPGAQAADTSGAGGELLVRVRIPSSTQGRCGGIGRRASYKHRRRLRPRAPSLCRASPNQKLNRDSTHEVLKNSGEFIMARFNTKAAKAQPTSRVTSTGRVLRTYEGGRGRERDERSELFLLVDRQLRRAADLLRERRGPRRPVRRARTPSSPSPTRRGRPACSAGCAARATSVRPRSWAPPST